MSARLQGPNLENAVRELSRITNIDEPGADGPKTVIFPYSFYTPQVLCAQRGLPNLSGSILATSAASPQRPLTMLTAFGPSPPSPYIKVPPKRPKHIRKRRQSWPKQGPIHHPTHPHEPLPHARRPFDLHPPRGAAVPDARHRPRLGRVGEEPIDPGPDPTPSAWAGEEGA